jgi:hypothetical protein
LTQLKPLEIAATAVCFLCAFMPHFQNRVQRYYILVEYANFRSVFQTAVNKILIIVHFMALTNDEILLKERIRHMLHIRGVTIASISDTPTLQARYGRQINGDAQVPFTTLHMLLDMFPDVDANWLILGEGHMQKTADRPHIHNTKNEVNGNSAGGSIYVGTSTIPYPVQALLNEKDKRIAELEEDKRRLHTVIDALTVKPRK